MIKACFTGHRPDKLGGYDWRSPKNQSIMFKLTEVITEILDKAEAEDEAVRFIFGGALGIDQMAFHICHKLKFSYGNIILELAIPFADQYIKWYRDDIARWRYQRDLADIVTKVDTLDAYKIKGLVEGMYHPAKMQKRNEYMVDAVSDGDEGSVVVSVWDGSDGGTKNCLKYANKKGVDIIRINPKEVC